jgi:hypothetical protein
MRQQLQRSVVMHVPGGDVRLENSNLLMFSIFQ